MTPKRFMLIAGEASGDVLGAELVKELRAGLQHRRTYTPNVQPLNADLAPQFFGAGGQRMAAAGVDLAFDLTQHSMTGVPGLDKYLKLRKLLDQLVKLACEREPHVIICVDFSVFNAVFAAAIKKYVRARRGTFNNWQPKIIKYISPQVWASRENRVYQIARDYDLLLSIFPFEQEWYAQRVPKFQVEFVGHPLLERYAHLGINGRATSELSDAASPLVLLLPGSRPRELSRHLPVILSAVKLMQSTIPQLRVQMILPTETLVRQAGTFPLSPQIEVRTSDLAESLVRADLAIASTGTVTMECAYFGVPTVTLYKTSWLTWQIGKRIVKVKSLTMPNLLIGEQVFPEFIQNDAIAENISRAALELLRDHSRRETIRSQLAKMIASLGDAGASRRAADAILKLVP